MSELCVLFGFAGRLSASLAKQNSVSCVFESNVYCTNVSVHLFDLVLR